MIGEIDLSSFTMWINGILVAIIIFVAKQVGDFVKDILKSTKSFEGKVTSVRDQVITLNEKSTKMFSEVATRLLSLEHSQDKMRRSIVHHSIVTRRRNKNDSEIIRVVKDHHKALQLTQQIVNKQNEKIADCESTIVQLKNDMIMIKKKRSNGES